MKQLKLLQDNKMAIDKVKLREKLIKDSGIKSTVSAAISASDRIHRRTKNKSLRTSVADSALSLQKKAKTIGVSSSSKKSKKTKDLPDNLKDVYDRCEQIREDIKVRQAKLMPSTSDATLEKIFLLTKQLYEINKNEKVPTARHNQFNMVLNALGGLINGLNPEAAQIVALKEIISKIKDYINIMESEYKIGHVGKDEKNKLTLLELAAIEVESPLSRSALDTAKNNTKTQIGSALAVVPGTLENTPTNDTDVRNNNDSYITPIQMHIFNGKSYNGSTGELTSPSAISEVIKTVEKASGSSFDWKIVLNYKLREKYLLLQSIKMIGLLLDRMEKLNNNIR